ncbi:MAG: alpha/beta fold hydrolase [Candidatus Bipolaricaulota bacterium]
MTTKTFLVLAALLALLILAVAPRWQEPGPTDQPIDEGRVIDVGHFVLEQAGRPMLDETYTLLFQPGEGYLLISQSTLTAGGLTLRLAQQTLYDEGLHPTSYQMAVDGAGPTQLVTASVTSGSVRMEVRVGVARQSTDASLGSSYALLDNNLIAHYAVLLAALRAERVETTFVAAVPQILSALPAHWEGPEPVRFLSGESEHEGDLYTVSVGDAELGLVAVDGKLVAVVNRAQNTVGYDVNLLPEGFALPTPPPADEPSAVHEMDVEFIGDAGSLSGTVARPHEGEPQAVVLLLAGSGPVDRDGDAPGLETGTYRQLAHSLARVGVASVRYDKRGVGSSEGTLATASRTDLVNDARRVLEQTTAWDGLTNLPVFVVGHSEGAYLAAELAAESEAVSGLVLLCGAAQSLADVTRWQVETLLRLNGAAEEAIAAALEQEDQYLAFVKASTGQWTDIGDEALREALPWLDEAGAAQLRGSDLGLAWLREHYNEDPSATLRRVRCPVLAVNGDKDVQVPPSEAAAIEEVLRAGGNAAVQGVLLEDLNHLLRVHPEEPSLVLRHLDQPVDPRVVDLLSRWILEQVDG